MTCSVAGKRRAYLPVLNRRRERSCHVPIIPRPAHRQPRRTQHLRLEYLEEAGPRIVHLSLLGPDGEAGENLMAEVPDVGIPTPYGTFRLYGGHRLWHSPEGMPRSYVPDNEGCGVERGENRRAADAAASRPPPACRRASRSAVAADRPAVTFTHTLQELRPVARRARALGPDATAPRRRRDLPADRGQAGRARPAAQSEPGAVAVHPARRPPAQPERRPCTSSTPTPDPHAVKIGYLNRAGWAAYLVGGVLFVKRWAPAAGRSARRLRLQLRELLQPPVYRGRDGRPARAPRARAVGDARRGVEPVPDGWRPGDGRRRP